MVKQVLETCKDISALTEKHRPMCQARFGFNRSQCWTI